MSKEAIEKAIELLKTMKDCNSRGCPTPYEDEEIDQAIAELEKSEPMPPYRPFEPPPGGGVREVRQQEPIRLKHKKDD